MNRKNVTVGLVATGLGFVVMSTMARQQTTAPGFGLCSPSALLALLNPELSAQSASSKAAKGQLAPDWQLSELDGKPINLSDFKGKVVILNFWATWCPPCRKEIPTIVALQKQYGGQGLVVVGVSLDQDAAAVEPLAQKMGIDYAVAIGNEEIAAAHGVQVIPTTFIIDRSGNIAAEHQGMRAAPCSRERLRLCSKDVGHLHVLVLVRRPLHFFSVVKTIEDEGRGRGRILSPVPLPVSDPVPNPS